MDERNCKKYFKRVNSRIQSEYFSLQENKNETKDGLAIVARLLENFFDFKSWVMVFLGNENLNVSEINYALF